MKDFLDYLAAHWDSIVSWTASIGAIVAAIINGIRAHKIKVSCDRILNEARERKTYTNCPHCKKKISLDELTFHLPGGAVDNNLDGFPDQQ